MLTIRIENYKIPSWNVLYGGKSHWVRTKMKDEAHKLVTYACMEQKIPKVDKPVDIEVVAHLVRLMDCDNVCAKLMIDGLKGRVLEDDNWRCVKSVKTRCVKDKRNWVEIHLSIAPLR